MSATGEPKRQYRLVVSALKNMTLSVEPYKAVLKAMNHQQLGVR
jgi:hypothetical protein